MQLSKVQFFSVIGVAVAVVALAAWWFLFKPVGGGPDNGATQIDHLSTDAQFASPQGAAQTQDSAGTLPGSNAP